MTDAELKEFMRDAIEAMRQSGLRTERALTAFSTRMERVEESLLDLRRESADTRDHVRAQTQALLALVDEIRGWRGGPRPA